MLSHETNYNLYKSGLLPETQWQSALRSVHNLSTTFGRLLWSEEKETFEPDFVAVIDSELAELEGDPNNLWLRGHHEKVADLDLSSGCGKPFKPSAFGC